MSVARLAERERAQLLVQSASRKSAAGLPRGLERAAAMPLPQRAVRWHLDVDPIEF